MVFDLPCQALHNKIMKNKERSNQYPVEGAVNVRRKNKEEAKVICRNRRIKDIWTRIGEIKKKGLVKKGKKIKVQMRVCIFFEGDEQVRRKKV